MAHEHSYSYRTQDHSEDAKIFEDGIWKSVKYCWSTAWEECSCGDTKNKVEGPKFRC